MNNNKLKPHKYQKQFSNKQEQIKQKLKLKKE